MDREIQQRLLWVRLYEETGNAGLASLSKRPQHSPNRKVWSSEELHILELRRTRNLGARRIQSELRRHFDISLALATIHKVLSRHGVKPLVQHRQKSGFVRYERPVPGDRIQMDTCKIGPNLYQYTAIDDCTRYRVLRLYDRRTTANTLDFLEAVLEEMPFPIQRIQTDRGRELFALKIQKRLMEMGVKFRPNKPGSPHLNGKVERSQKTDKLEFYATVDTQSEAIHDQLAEWQHYYNWDRPHSAHGGSSPMERFFELIHQTPFSDEVDNHYVAEKERIRDPNYRLDLQLSKLKRSL